MTNKNKHLSDESIVALISNTLSETDEKNYQAHLDSCADCMLNYSEKQMDLNELESIEIKAIPEEIKDSIGLTENKKSIHNVINGFIKALEQFADWAFNQPTVKVRLAMVGVAVLLITVISVRIYTGDKQIKINPDMFGSHQLEFTSDDGLKLMSIYLSADSIKISQQIKIPRMIRLSNTEGVVFFEETFDSNLYIQSIEHLTLDKAIHLQMFTGDNITVDSVFVIQSD